MTPAGALASIVVLSSLLSCASSSVDAKAEESSESSASSSSSSSSAGPSSSDAGSSEAESSDAESSDATTVVDDTSSSSGGDCDPDALDWAPVFETVVPNNYTGYTTTVDVDDAGVVYVGHEYSQYCFMVDNASGSWSSQIAGFGYWFDIDVDGSGHARASWVQGTGFAVLDYDNTVGSTNVEFPESDPMLHEVTVADGRFLAVDDSGRAHVAYGTQGDQGVWYSVRNDLDDWSVEQVDAAGMNAASLAVSGDGQPWIFYDSPAGAQVATKVGGVWSFETLGTSGFFVSAVVDGDGVVHAALGHGETTITYATNEGGAWTETSIGTFAHAGWKHIELADDGTLYIVSENLSAPNVGTIDLLTNFGGKWQQRPLRDDTSVGQPDIAIAGDTIYVSHTVVSSEVALARVPLADGVDNDCDGDAW